MEPLTASAIVTLALGKVFETTIEKATESTLAKIKVLRDKIWNKLRGKQEVATAFVEAEKGKEADLEKVVNSLEEVMKSDPNFAQEIEKLASQIQPEIRIGQIRGESVQGNVGGDNVGGDKTTVGDISGSTGIAVGKKASATVNITNQLQNSSNPEVQKLGKLLEQLQVEIEREDSGLIQKNRDKALKHLETIGKFGDDRQNSDLRDNAETALDALETILNQGTGFNQTGIGTLLTSIKENLGF